MKEYKKRVADQILSDKLESSGAVLIEGPKYCGKTTLASQQAGSILSMADPDRLSQNLALARIQLLRKLFCMDTRTSAVQLPHDCFPAHGGGA